MAELDIERTVAAAPEKVWNAWTQYPDIAYWWWPASFNVSYDIEAKVGGTYHFEASRAPGVGSLGLSGAFLQIEEPRRLVYTWRWDSEPSYESRVVVEFRPRGESTLIQIHHDDLIDDEDIKSHRQGWNDCLDRLQELLEAKTTRASNDGPRWTGTSGATGGGGRTRSSSHGSI